MYRRLAGGAEKVFRGYLSLCGGRVRQPQRVGGLAVSSAPSVARRVLWRNLAEWLKKSLGPLRVQQVGNEHELLELKRRWRFCYKIESPPGRWALQRGE
jgi:hypothetical protein